MVSDKIIKISMKSAKALITAVLLLTAVLFLRPGKETKADPGFGYAFDYRLVGL